MIDQNLFFRNATLKISSSLNIEKALWHCLWYLQEIIPVGQICIHLFDEKTGIAEAIAHATLEDYRAMSVKTRMPRESLRHIEAQRSLRIRNVANTNHNPVTAPLCRPLGCSGLAALVMDLVIEAKFLGVVSFISLPDEVFTREHKELVAQLNEPFAIAVTNSIRYREIQRYKEQLEDDNKYLHRRLSRLGGESVVGSDFGLKGVMELVRQVAPIDSPVLLLGETGVGKEVIARTIHNLSDRGEGPFIDVNCGAIPESLMDSELFGHEKGSFTGAVAKKRGLFERAQGGTIFLDEIGDIGPSIQTKLLRVIQEKEIKPLGDNKVHKVDVRIIASTNQNLAKKIEAKEFREDLYYRLSVIPIELPPLRDRREDISLLADHLVTKHCKKMEKAPKTIDDDVMDLLTEHPWKGNVRELENILVQGILYARGETIQRAHIPIDGGSNPKENCSCIRSNDIMGLPYKAAKEAVLTRFNHDYIGALLSLTGGNITQAAKKCGLDRQALQQIMKRFNVDPSDFR